VNRTLNTFVCDTFYNYLFNGMLSEAKAILSAKWRRYRHYSKRFHISRGHNRVGDRKTPNPFRIKNMRIRRGKYPYKHNNLSICNKRRKWKEPEPLIDVFEDKDKIVVVTEFAGFKRENLEIHITDQQLTLSAEASGRRYYRNLILPRKVAADTLHTSYKNGVLEIQLKKMFEEKVMDKVAG